jgi:FKBP-type peptidyl-prolyl cis-trans isomerase
VKKIMLALLAGVLLACGSSDDTTGPDEPTTLVVQDLTVGTGAVAADGNVLTVHYIGTLRNGTEFDNSYRRNQPFSFRLGAGSVIAGWDQGLPGMRVGGRRRLTIPAALGYGNNPPVGSGIPRGATLYFDVELIEVTIISR